MFCGSFALFVRSKFYLRQMISVACGIAIGVFLSLLLAPFLDRMCMFDSPNFPPGAQKGVGDLPLTQPFQASSPPLPKSTPSRSTTSKNRPHFLSHELGIRNKLLSVTIVTSPSDLPLVQLLYQNLYHGAEATNVPFSVVAILAGQQSLISSIEQEVKTNLSSFLTMRLRDSQPATTASLNAAFSVGQYVEDQGNNNGGEDTRHLFALLTETLMKISEQYRTQFDWFSIAFPQVYIRFDKLYEELLMMSPTYDRLLFVPQSGETGYSCDSSITTSRRPFKSILLSNKLMNDMYAVLQSSLCPKDSLSFDSLECLDDFFRQACLVSYATDMEKFQVAEYPADASLLPHIAGSLAVFPAAYTNQYITLNKLFLEQDYNTTLAELNSVREELHRLITHLPDGENKPSWPIDVQPPLKPRQRFDIAPWQFLNASHVFFTDEYTTVQLLAGPDLEDVIGVTAEASAFIEKTNPNRYKFVSLESGYRKFDPVRGMEYLLYLLFEDTLSPSRENVLKFMHVLKPLNRLEPINAPHVTEDAVITLVVPVFVDVIDEAEEVAASFLEQVLALLKVGDRLKLWLLLVYPSTTTAVDPFLKLKSLVADGESQFPGRLAWLAVQTSHRSSLHLFEAVIRSRQTQATPSTSNRNSKDNKDNEEWLVLMLPPESLLSREFLNRVRLMTIRRYQVYFPIAFSQYHPDLIAEPLLLSAINGATSTAANSAPNQQHVVPSPTTTTVAPSDSSNVVELTSRHGHFDQFDFDTAAFYLSDYSECRRLIASGDGALSNPVDVADVFLACTQLHVFRAVDPGLRRFFRQTSCDSFTPSADQASESCRARLEIGLGNRKHMAAKLSEHVQSATVVTPSDNTPLKNIDSKRVVDDDRDYQDHDGDLVNAA